MKRIILLITGFALLALFAATLVLWFRSHWVGNEWRSPTRIFKSGAGVLQLDVYGGGIGPYLWDPSAPPAKLVGPPPLMWQHHSGGGWAGFELREYHVFMPIMSIAPPPGITWTLTRWQAPYWSLAFLEVIVLAFWAIPLSKTWRRRNWARNHRCTHCGYDLRASPDRCPECGTSAPNR